MSINAKGKTFYCDYGTSIVAVRCGSDRAVVEEFNLNDSGKFLAEEMCKLLNREADALMLKQSAEMKERLAAVVKHLEKYKGTKEPDYCCADCIEDIAKEVGFSFASGEGGAE